MHAFVANVFIADISFYINISVIATMTEGELGKYIVRYVDLAVRAFCHQRLAACETTKSTALQRLRDKIQKRGSTSGNDDGLLSKLSGIGNKHASKETRRLEIGWLHFYKGENMFVYPCL